MTSEFSLQKDKILDLDTRKKIYNLVKEHAGCHFRDIGRKSNLPASSVKYHLNYLTKHRLIQEEKDGNNIRYFPREFNTDNKVLLGLLRQKSLRKILILLLTNKNCSHGEIVRFLRLSPSTVSWHLKKLVEKGFIKSNQIGKRIKYSSLVKDDEVINLLMTYQDSFLDSLVNKVMEMWEIG